MYMSCALYLGMSLFVVISSDQLTEACECGMPSSPRSAVIAATTRLLQPAISAALPGTTVRELTELVEQMQSDPAPEAASDWWRCQQIKLCVAELSRHQTADAPRTPAASTTVWQVSIGRGFLRGNLPTSGVESVNLSMSMDYSQRASTFELQETLNHWEQHILDQLADELCGRLAKP